jgi:hypothetical protein
VQDKGASPEVGENKMQKAQKNIKIVNKAHLLAAFLGRYILLRR